MRTIAFCEIEPYCRAVLAKHWPGVPIYGDVRELHLPQGFAEVICGGFPCQDISLAGDGAGLSGIRSGLWSEYLRLIEEVQPRFAVIENVGALRSRGLETILRQLAAIRYDAEWYCIPASAVGAPHRRDRVWIVAYAERELVRLQSRRSSGESRPDSPLLAIDGALRALADTDQSSGDKGRNASSAEDRQRLTYRGWWSTEPDVDRVADGVPSRVDRLRALGNAVVPQIPEIIGREIMRVAA